MNLLRRMDAPNGPWLDRLRRGHYVWLVKDQRFGRIEWAWVPPEPGCRTGRIGLSILGPGTPENIWTGPPLPQCPWFIGADGAGLDGRPLLEPVEGNLPDEAAPISEPVIRHLHRQLEKLLTRISEQESRIRKLEKQNDWLRRDFDLSTYREGL